jgi:hypothetical protein
MIISPIMYKYIMKYTALSPERILMNEPQPAIVLGPGVNNTTENVTVLSLHLMAGKDRKQQGDRARKVTIAGNLLFWGRFFLCSQA